MTQSGALECVCYKQLKTSVRRPYTLPGTRFLTSFACAPCPRGVRAYQMLNVPVLGLVENMSYHVCRNCGHKEHTFGEQGVQRMAQELGMELLGEVGGLRGRGGGREGGKSCRAGRCRVRRQEMQSLLVRHISSLVVLWLIVQRRYNWKLGGAMVRGTVCASVCS